MIKVFKYSVVLMVLLCFCSNGYARQQKVSGTIRNASGKTLENVPVTLKNKTGKIMQFVYTGTDGKYELSVADTTSSLHIEVNFLGYQKESRELQAGKRVYDFTLVERVIELEEIKIKSKPIITNSGDTLTYDVASFAQPEDRSIGDVMRHLPGVEVAEDGQVFINGKAISNLYFHGDELMDGRYGMATKAVTKEMIKSIQVIQNHQPIKVLKNKVITENVAVNLVLKDENSVHLAGQGMVGGGLPGQFDMNGNAMMFNTKFKMINSLKANNSGVDLKGDLTQFSSQNFLDNMGNSRPRVLLSAGTAGAPDIPRSNYYINRSALLNLNNLVNLKNGLQLRINAQGFLDRNTFNYTNEVNNLLPGGNIRYDELQDALRTPRSLNTSFMANMNKDRYYLNNILRVNAGDELQSSYIDLNGFGFRQHLKERIRDISNDLSYTPAIARSGVLDLRWYFNYSNNPQRLDINSGLNAAVLNNGQPYLGIIQHTATPTWFNHITAAYRQGGELIRQHYQVGLLNERQNLQSGLQLLQNDQSLTFYNGDAGNDLDWQRDRLYFTPGYDIVRPRWNMGITLPVMLQSIRYKQDAYLLNEKKEQLLFNPTFRMQVSVSSEDNFSVNYAFRNSVGNISGVYRGTILSNYRSLSANNADLQEQETQGGSISYAFKRSLVMLFINAGVSYNKVTANTIMSSVLTNNIQTTVLLPYENDQSMLSVNGGISKYLFALKTTVSLKGTWSRSRYSQFINAEQLSFNNDMYSLTAGLDGKVFRKITLAYNGSGAWSKSFQENRTAGLSNSVRRFDQNITVGYSPAINLFINLQGRHIYSEQAGIQPINYLFLNSKVRYKLAKWRTDIEFDLTNMLNVKHYEVFNLSSNQFSASRYDIRGMMGIVRGTFNF